MLSIYNGVEYDPESRGKHNIFTHSPFRFTQVGQITKAKGSGLLVEAVAKLTAADREKMHLDFIGDFSTPYAQKLIRSVNERKLDDTISFLGYCENVSELLRQYDVGLMCSESEDFGRVTAEYMLNGCLVIGSDSGATGEMLGHGEYGLLYRCGDVNDLAERLRFALHHADEATALAQRGQTYAEENYTAKKNAEAIYDLYSQFVKKQ